MRGFDVGTATEYGLTDAWEDFAEYVAEVGTNPNTLVCQEMRGTYLDDARSGLMRAKILLASGIGAIPKMAVPLLCASSATSRQVDWLGDGALGGDAHPEHARRRRIPHA